MLSSIFTFIETPGTGEYVCTNFEPVIGETYTLKVIIGSQVYSATEKLIASPEIASIEQDEESGFEVRFGNELLTADEVQRKHGRSAP